MRSIRVLMTVALLAGAFMLAAGPADAVRGHNRAHHRIQLIAAGPEGCVSSNPANPQYANPCTYTATTTGGIAGIGSWKVTITRGTNTIVYTDSQGPNQSIGTIKAGDVVKTTALTAGSIVAAGNPCPASVPGAC